MKVGVVLCWAGLNTCHRSIPKHVDNVYVEYNCYIYCGSLLTSSIRAEEAIENLQIRRFRVRRQCNWFISTEYLNRKDDVFHAVVKSYTYAK